MKLSRQILFATSITLAAIIVPRFATAAEHVVEMRNKDDAGNTMAFQPGFVKVEVGDTVKFVPTDKSHNAESVREVWPEGVAPVKGGFSKEVVFNAEKEGLYVLKCARITAWAWSCSCRSASPSTSTRSRNTRRRAWRKNASTAKSRRSSSKAQRDEFEFCRLPPGRGQSELVKTPGQVLPTSPRGYSFHERTGSSNATSSARRGSPASSRACASSSRAFSA